jgi:thiol-disulfide isomerase/thioredoxin
MNNKVLGIIIVLVAIASFLGGASFNQWRAEKQGVTPRGEVTPSPSAQQLTPTTAELASTIGNFSVLEEEVCQEDGKPIVYFFGSQTCPHCSWEHPLLEAVIDKFSNQVSFHNNMDSDEDTDVFQEYTPVSKGYIPFILLGCQYARVGSGENYGEDLEEDYLTALICQLTDNQPETVCSGVEDLIEQVD